MHLEDLECDEAVGWDADSLQVISPFHVGGSVNAAEKEGLSELMSTTKPVHSVRCDERVRTVEQYSAEGGNEHDPQREEVLVILEVKEFGC